MGPAVRLIPSLILGSILGWSYTWITETRGVILVSLYRINPKHLLMETSEGCDDGCPSCFMLSRSVQDKSIQKLEAR